MVAGGGNNREIARQLFISETTVKTHLLHVYGKFGVRDRAAAVAVGYERVVDARRRTLSTPGHRAAVIR